MKNVLGISAALILLIAGYFVAKHNGDENLILNAFAYGWGVPLVLLIFVLAARSNSEK